MVKKSISKADIILEHIENSNYKRPQTIQDLIDNRDILFNIIDRVLDEEVRGDKKYE